MQSSKPIFREQQQQQKARLRRRRSHPLHHERDHIQVRRLPFRDFPLRVLQALGGRGIRRNVETRCVFGAREVADGL